MVFLPLINRLVYIGRTYIHFILLAPILTIYFFFSLQHITQFITADEHYWIEERIPQYWNAWSEGNWKKTYINDKPGVSLALVSGAGLLFDAHPETLCSKEQDEVTLCDAERTPGVLLSLRLPIVIVNALLIVYCFWVFSLLAGKKIATFGALFLALSPILLGITQIINPDALLWSLGTASLLSFLALLQLRKKKFILLSGIFLGLSILAKYVASFLIPFFIFLIIIHLFFLKGNHKRNISIARENFLFIIKSILIAILTLLLFLPAIWEKFSILLDLLSGGDGTFFSIIPFLSMLLLGIDIFLFQGRTIFLVKSYVHKIQLIPRMEKILIGIFLTLTIVLIIGRSMTPEWELFIKIPFDIKDLYSSDKIDKEYYPNLLQAILLEMNPLIFSLPPVILFFVAFYGLRRLFSKTMPSFESFTFLSFIFLFIIVIYLSQVLATARYLVLLYPILALLAALGIQESLTLFRTRWALFLSIGGTLLLTISSTAFSAPFYFNYTNSLLPKEQIVHHAWGYGGYEAAQYLNTLPNAKELVVWADYYGVCEFFVGRCVAMEYDAAAKHVFDYAVVSHRGKNLYRPEHTRWLKEKNLQMSFAYTTLPQWQLLIGGRPENFVKVVKVDNQLRTSIITDIDHCPSREAVSELHLDAFIASTIEAKSDFIVSLGDNASHRLRDCSKTGDADARYVADRLRSSEKPVHLVLGDHDIMSSITSYKKWLETTGREQTYYSFHQKGVHIIVLDTVLGGEPMLNSCADSQKCALLTTRLSDVDTLTPAHYQEKYPDAQTSPRAEKRLINSLLSQQKTEIALTRSFGNRDRGRISDEELAWLKQDLAETPLNRVVVFSDHPLFPFVSERKQYDIVGGDPVRQILEESGKEVVAISGEAHLWHQETKNGIHYFIVDEFRKVGGSWAFFSWGKDSEPHLERFIGRQKASDSEQEAVNEYK